MMWGFLYSRAVVKCANYVGFFVQPSGCEVCQLRGVSCTDERLKDVPMK
jgi:hypothetical protein